MPPSTSIASTPSARSACVTPCGGDAAVADHGDGAVKAARRGAGSASTAVAGRWRERRAGRLDPPRRIVADVQHGQRRAVRQALGEV